MQYYGVYMCNTVVVQWNIHMQCVRYIYSGAYTSNVTCMHTSVLVIWLIAVGSYDANILT